MSPSNHNPQTASLKPQTALLSSTYFGPVQWYQKLNRYGLCLIEQHDHFIKQTFRNRCVIATTQGVQALTVPVESPEGERIDKTEMKDVRISDHGSWRHLHWQALQSAYGESPFFEFYADDLLPFFERKWTYLFDFNMAITEKMCELLDIQPRMERTEEYVASPLSHPQMGGGKVASPLTPPQRGGGEMLDKRQEPSPSTDNAGLPYSVDTPVDFRSVIRPKHPMEDEEFVARPYYQVYQQKFGFIPNLSILDLLFNEGNEAIMWL